MAEEPAARRPRSVTVAATLALGGSLLTATYALVVLVALVLDQGSLPAGLRVPVAVTALAVTLGWSVGAMALAWFTLRGSRGARIALAASAALAGSLGLTLSSLFSVAVLIMVACIATIVLLFSTSAREWFRGQEGVPVQG